MSTYICQLQPPEFVYQELLQLFPQGGDKVVQLHLLDIYVKQKGKMLFLPQQFEPTKCYLLGDNSYWIYSYFSD